MTKPKAPPANDQALLDTHVMAQWTNYDWQTKLLTEFYTLMRKCTMVTEEYMQGGCYVMGVKGRPEFNVCDVQSRNRALAANPEDRQDNTLVMTLEEFRAKESS